MSDMIDRAAQAVANFVRSTSAGQRLSYTSHARAALLAALDPEDMVLVETMAKAMFECDPAFGGTGLGAPSLRWEDVSISNGPYWRGKARAAIAALRNCIANDVTEP